MNKKMLTVLALVIAGLALILMSMQKEDVAQKSTKKQISLDKDSIVSFKKKVRTKKFTDAALSQIPMNSKKRKELLKGKEKKSDTPDSDGGSGYTPPTSDELEAVGSLIKDQLKEQDQQENPETTEEDPTVVGGINQDVDDGEVDDLDIDEEGGSGSSLDGNSDSGDSIVSQESEIVVETDGRQLLIERKFAGDILSCSGQTSWDSHHLYHPIPSGNRVNIICETTAGFVIVDSSLDNL